MTAHPVDDGDSDDPVEILGVLPEDYHAQFLAEYTAAVDGARRPEQFRRLQELLRLCGCVRLPTPVPDTGSGWQLPVMGAQLISRPRNR